MKSFPLKITSSEGDLFCGEVQRLCVRGTEGELAVMAGHIPFVTCLQPCDCRLTLADGSKRVGKTAGGVLTVSKTGAVLLVSEFLWQDAEPDAKNQ